MGHISITKIVTDQRHNDSMDIAFLLYTLMARSQFYESKYYGLESRLASVEGPHDYHASMVNSM